MFLPIGFIQSLKLENPKRTSQDLLLMNRILKTCDIHIVSYLWQTWMENFKITQTI